MWGAEEVAALLNAEADLHRQRRRWLPTAREIAAVTIAVAVAVPITAALRPAPEPAPPLPSIIELTDPFGGLPVRCTLTAGALPPRYACTQEAR